jgi:hypothetical protein
MAVKEIPSTAVAGSSYMIMRTHKPATGGQGNLFVAKSAPLDKTSVQDAVDQHSIRVFVDKNSWTVSSATRDSSVAKNAPSEWPDLTNFCKHQEYAKWINPKKVSRRFEV